MILLVVALEFILMTSYLLNKNKNRKLCSMKTENVLLQEPSMSRSHLMIIIDYAVLRSIEHVLMFVSCDKLDYIFICRFSQGLMKCVPVIKVASN